MCFTNGEEVGESSRAKSERECKQLEDDCASIEAQELNTFNMEVSGLSWFVRKMGVFYFILFYFLQETEHIK
jgi:hypothetical protein